MAFTTERELYEHYSDNTITHNNIDSLIYAGTQNTGDDILESEEFTDLSKDAFYFVKTTGGSGYTIQYD